MTSDYRIRVDGVDEILNRTIINDRVRAKLIQRSVLGGGLVLQRGLQRRIPVDSGQSRASINTQLKIRGGARASISALVGGKSITPTGFNILRALEEGTGLFGPRVTVIRPVRAKVLSWVPRRSVSGTGTGQRIFRPFIRGMRPVRPFQRTINEDGRMAVRVFSNIMAQGIARGG